MTTLTITHTTAQGTLLEGTTKGDGAWEAIKGGGYLTSGWRYFRSMGQFGVHMSRDRAPKLAVIDATAKVLRAAGFDVDVEIDGTPRDYAEAEAERADRMEGRAERLEARAERKAGESDARYQAAHRIADGIPMGQPILVGHHSERRHRRDIERMHTNMRASVEADKEAKRAADAAASAARHMEARENPRRVYRRIRTQEAELRKVERALAASCQYSGARMKERMAGQPWNCVGCGAAQEIGADLVVPGHGSPSGRYLEQLTLNKAHLEEQLRYWREALQAARDSGADVPPDTDAVKKGWWIRSWAGWNEVVRVNKVSVTIRDTYGNPSAPADHPSQWFTRTITLDDVREIRETSPFAVPAPADAVELDAAVKA